jgi:hypothetical protein
LSLRAFIVGCQAGAFLLSPSALHAQPPVPAPRAAATSAVKTKAQKPAPAKPAPSKPATKQPTAPPPPQATTPAPRSGASVTPAIGESAPKLPPMPPIDTSKPPPSLPRASREKMRACAEEWDELKRRTRVGELTWRVFATKCLTR